MLDPDSYEWWDMFRFLEEKETDKRPKAIDFGCYLSGGELTFYRDEDYKICEWSGEEDFSFEDG